MFFYGRLRNYTKRKADARASGPAAANKKGIKGLPKQD